VLTCRFPTLKPSVRGQEGGVENALDIAIDTHCIRFLKNTQDCINHFWNGNIHLQRHQPPTSNLLCPPLSSQNRSVRLKIPKYQYLFHLVFFFLFLATYTIVINQKSLFLHASNISGAEAVMWLFALSFGMEEARQAYVGGFQFYLISLWNWLDIISSTIFAVAFILRIVAQLGWGVCSPKGIPSCTLFNSDNLIFRPSSVGAGF
jgi:hypothetical protein